MAEFPMFSAIFIQVVGFAVLYAILNKFFFGPVGQVIEERERHIQHQIDDADAQRKKMIAVREDYESRIVKIENEAREKIQEAMRQANQAREELIAQARDQAEKVVEKGKKELELERQKAQAELREKVSELSLLAASKIIDKALKPKDHEKIIDEVLSTVQAI